MKNNSLNILLTFLIGLGSSFLIYNMFFIVNSLNSITDLKLLKKINNVSFKSYFDYTIGETNFYKGKELIFYTHDKNHIISVLKNDKKNDYVDAGILNGKVFNYSLHSFFKNINFETLKCEKNTEYDINSVKEKGFNVVVSTDIKNYYYYFFDNKMYLSEIGNNLEGLQDNRNKIKHYKCDFDLEFHKTMIENFKTLN